MATIGHYYIFSCSSAAKDLAVDVQRLAILSGIKALPHLLDNEKTTNLNESSSTNSSELYRVSDSSMANLLNALALATGDAFLGFAKPKVPFRYFQLLLQSLYYCKDIEAAICTLVTGLELTGCDLRLVKNKYSFSLQLSHHHQDPNHFLTEYLLVFIHRLLSWLTAKPLVMDEIAINYTPVNYRQEFTLLFRSPVLFDQPDNSLTFDNKYLALPVLREQTEFQEVISQFPLIVLRFPGDETQLNRLVYQKLTTHFLREQTFCTATTIANELNMSTATLRRKLASLLTSFSQIKVDIRKEQAIILLKQPTKTIEDIANALDYSEARAFSRVFKQWTGLTPSQYRQLMPI